MSPLSTTVFRTAAAAVGIFVVASVIIIALLIRHTNFVLTNQVLRTLSVETEVLSQDVRRGGIAALQEAVSTRSRIPGSGLYLMQSSDGRKLAGNLSRLPPEIASSPDGGVFYYSAPGSGTDEKRMAVAVSRNVAGARLIVGRDIEDQRNLAGRIRNYSLVGFGILALVGWLTGLGFSRLVLRRVDQMNNAAKTIMGGDLAGRIPSTGSGDELDDLAANLNAMLARIEQLMLGMREVSDNIAHDLKTPLNRLRVRAEAALRDPRGAPAHREGLEQTIEAADELIRTFNALLLIARLEAGAFDDSVETVNVSTLVLDVSELYAPVAEEKGMTLSTNLAGTAVLSGNRQLIGQAVANLIDNAIKYAATDPKSPRKPTARVDVSVISEMDQVRIEVADTGPGIGKADRARVIGRFVRLEKSRTTPGTGLGLSLVSAVARLHQGKFALEDNAPGLKTVLILPVSLDAAASKVEPRRQTKDSKIRAADEDKVDYDDRCRLHSPRSPA